LELNRPFVSSAVNARWHMRRARFGGSTSQRHGANAMRTGQEKGQRQALIFDSLKVSGKHQAAARN
jgi:hypothetical protein